jgi:hypothetical protein
MTRPIDNNHRPPEEIAMNRFAPRPLLRIAGILLAAVVRRDWDKWGAVVKASGFTAD